MTSNTQIKGIDVSYWQGKVDWARVKADGIGFAILRAVGGTNEDSEFLANLAGVIENDIPYGVYIYTKAKTFAEIDREISLLKTLMGDNIAPVGVFYDMEDISLRTLSKETLTNNMLYALEKIKSTGQKAGIYSNPDWLYYVLDYERLKDYPLWLACYTTIERRDKLFDGDIYIWQYGNDTVDGINTIVDVNILYKQDSEATPPNTQVKVTNCLAAWIRTSPDKASKAVTVVVRNTTLLTDNKEYTDKRGVTWLHVFTKNKSGYIGKVYTQAQ